MVTSIRCNSAAAARLLSSWHTTFRPGLEAKGSEALSVLVGATLTQKDVRGVSWITGLNNLISAWLSYFQ